MADNDALLAKFQAIIKAEVSTITKNSDTNTAELKKSITGIKQDISQNAEKIKEVNTRVDEVTDELKEMKKKINDLENAGSPSKSYMEAIKTIDTKIQTIIEKTDNTKRDIAKEARKIMGISPITQGDLEYLTNTGIQKDNILKESVKSSS